MTESWVMRIPPPLCHSGLQWQRKFPTGITGCVLLECVFYVRVRASVLIHWVEAKYASFKNSKFGSVGMACSWTGSSHVLFCKHKWVSMFWILSIIHLLAVDFQVCWHDRVLVRTLAVHQEIRVLQDSFVNLHLACTLKPRCPLCWIDNEIEWCPLLMWLPPIEQELCPIAYVCLGTICYQR